ncbi:pyridoxal phosphate-dependent aminotransferase [Loktanella salsilacus]|uniref:pyridoxal phosphate-dependent aminotransferase n=1 Tax=Loktanella salsilacus TaxID=195913 RepID=UPI0030FA46F3
MAHPTDPRLTPLAQSLPATVPFVGPETQERTRGKPFAARLGANESGFGPSPRAIAALQSSAADIWQYPDPEAYDLRQALAAHHDIDAAHIMVGEGIDTLLGNLVRLIITSGDAVITSAGAYPTFNYHVTGFGGVLHSVPYAGNHEDPDRLIAKAKEVGAKLIYIANPDNPMGSHHDAATLQRMISAVPDGCLLVLDEAYIDLAPDGTAPYVAPHDHRVIRMRTFSKAYGLAGARTGYAIGPAPLIAAFDRVRNHFGMNRSSQAAALAALADQDWLTQVQGKVAACRDSLAAIARGNGLTPLPSATNFVTIDCGQDGTFARRVLVALGDAGIFVRMPFVAPHDRCIRVSCGPDAEIAAFAAALPQALASARSQE